MSVSSPPTVSAPLELNLLRWEDRERHVGHWTWVGAASALLHVLALGALTLTPDSWWKTNPVQAPVIVRRTTPLIAPRFELTQKEANKAKVSKQVDLSSLLSHTPSPHTTPTPPTPAKAAASPAPPSPPPSPAPAPKQQQAPPVERAALAPPPGLPTANPALPPAPAPQIQAEAPQPKLAFETPTAPSPTPAGRGSGIGRLAPPRNSVDEAIRSAIRNGGSGLTVGDAEDPVPSLAPRTPGGIAKPSSSVELLSDPQGVDFKPYLIRVLTAVRRNWMAVIPESARFGGVRGRVLVQFAINRDGSVRKIVFAANSGSEALDRAAIAGISASTPFPALPNEFPGPEVRLQLSFTYSTR